MSSIRQALELIDLVEKLAGDYAYVKIAEVIEQGYSHDIEDAVYNSAGHLFISGAYIMRTDKVSDRQIDLHLGLLELDREHIDKQIEGICRVRSELASALERERQMHLGLEED